MAWPPCCWPRAAGGDQVARDLVQRQASEISTMALVAMRRLGLTGLKTPGGAGRRPAHRTGTRC